MSEIIKVAIDAMGGDDAPGVIIEGCMQALHMSQDVFIYLVGDEKIIGPMLERESYDKERLEVVNASEVITNNDHPVLAIKQKKDSSMVVALKLVREGKAQAFISAGSTGAILVGGQVIVGRDKGVLRPALAPLMPTLQGFSLLIDCGANVDARPEHLVQYARMGSIYYENTMKKASPTVAILNIGAEEEKGNALVRAAYPLLKECSDINFIGSIEARDIPYGKADIIVCEAFAGNIVLKMYEGTANALFSKIKGAFMANFKTKIAALMLKSQLKKTLKDYDSTDYGGAPMLGLKRLVVKAHGSCSAKEFRQAILQCLSFYRADVSGKIAAAIAAAREKESLQEEEQ